MEVKWLSPKKLLQGNIVLLMAYFEYKKSRVTEILRYFGNPAVCMRPLGFPPHSREWFSSIVIRNCKNVSL